MNKKSILILACVAIFAFFLGGAFLVYSSYIKTQELQAKVKLEQEKTKQEMIKNQNEQQQMAQVTTSLETSTPAAAKKRTNYYKNLEKFWRSAVLETTLNADAEDAQVFQMYDGYSEPVRTLPSHRILAVNRGEKKGCLSVRLTLDHEENIAWIYKRIHQRPSIFEEELHAAM